MSTRYFLRMINPHLHSIDDLVPRTRVRTGRLHLHRFEHSSECCVAYSHLEEAEFHRRPSQTWMPPSVLGTWTTSSVCTEVGSYTQDDMLRILEHSETAHVGEFSLSNNPRKAVFQFLDLSTTVNNTCGKTKSKRKTKSVVRPADACRHEEVKLRQADKGEDNDMV